MLFNRRDVAPTGVLALSFELLKLLLAKDTGVVFQILYGEPVFLTLGFLHSCFFI